jgi:hypothetical protein
LVEVITPQRGGGGKKKKVKASIGGGGEEKTKALEIRGKTLMEKKKKKKPQRFKDSNQEPQIILVKICVWRNFVVIIAQIFFNKNEHYYSVMQRFHSL